MYLSLFLINAIMQQGSLCNSATGVKSCVLQQCDFVNL
jgi:hypothetical protein